MNHVHVEVVRNTRTAAVREPKIRILIRPEYYN